MVQEEKLRTAVNEVEGDKWRLVATKLQKPGLNPQACQQKWEELLEDEQVAERKRRHPSEDDDVIAD